VRHSRAVPTTRPVVVTLVVDGAAQRRWDALRTRHFPADRLVVGAHVTLFHAIPGDHEATALTDVRAVAARTRPFPVAEGAPYSLGRGVALRVTSPALLAVHADLAARWAPWLTRQDRQPFRPHVTVQSKVDPDTARRTLAELTATTGGGTATATGLALWHYDGGPWSPLATAPFDPAR
jgi:2'-5' RNA ligase